MSLPLSFDLGLMLSPWALLAAIALATLVSEDLTCITVGLLVANERADLLVGVAGCFLGIFVGDLGLWLFGRWAGRRVLRWSRGTKMGRNSAGCTRTLSIPVCSMT